MPEQSEGVRELRKLRVAHRSPFAHNAGVDVRLELERVLYRVQLSAVELQLQPEVFQATQELRIASGELASPIKHLELPNTAVPARLTIRARG
jgi:hypothetical protein